MAILQKKYRKKKVTKENINEITTLALAINDHLQMVKFDSEKLSKLQKDQQAFESLICNFWFNTDERFKYLLTRYNILFFDLFQSELFKTQFPIGEYFKKATGGLDLGSYFILGFAILANFVRASRIKPSIAEPSLNEGFFLLNTSTDFAKTKTDIGELKKIFREFSADLDYFRTQYKMRKKSKGLDPNYDFLPFICKPLIKLSENHCILSSRRFLEEKITTGVYWLIHDYVKHNRKEYGDFKRIFGKVFETYICSILKRIFPSEGPLLIKQLFTEEGYSKGKDPHKTSDAMIFYDEEAIFVEATTSQSRIDTILSGRLEQFQIDIEKIIIDKTRELSNVITDYKNGCFKIPNFSAEKIRKIQPLLVTLKPLPVLPPLWRGVENVWNGIEAEMKRRNYLQQPYCERLLIISAEELEMLEPLIETGKLLTELLKSWREDPFFCDYQLKRFIEYKYYKYGKMDDYDNKFLDERYMQIKSAIREKLFGDEED